MVKTMRAAILVLGPTLARFGDARVSLPGVVPSFAPVDLHIKGLQAMGANISIEHGYIHAAAGACRRAYRDGRVTVTGTENLMMAAALAEGTTVAGKRRARTRSGRSGTLSDRDGAKIEGAGSDVITIHGVDALHGAEYA